MILFIGKRKVDDCPDGKKSKAKCQSKNLFAKVSQYEEMVENPIHKSNNQEWRNK
jgi:hypothetical protein